MLNPLKIATDGYLKQQAKAVLIISVAGYLNFTTPIPSGNVGSGSQIKKEFVWDDGRKRQILKEDAELVEILKTLISCL